MALLDKIRIIERDLRLDKRGWFLKTLNGFEQFLPDRTGEIYLTMALPEEWRANHFHKLADEWFTVFSGQALLILEDVETKERMEIELDGAVPKTIFVPAGVAHVFKNTSEEKPMLLLAYASETYDPRDTIAYRLLTNL